MDIDDDMDTIQVNLVFNLYRIKVLLQHLPSLITKSSFNVL